MLKRLRNAAGSRTSHHLIIVSKHFRGYEIMKEIIAKESSSAEHGVASFEYNPARRDQGLLFELARPLDDLADLVMTKFAGQELPVKEVYERHNVATRFTKRNYKAVLLKLEAAGEVRAEPAATDRRKRTIADHVRIRFPVR